MSFCSKAKSQIWIVDDFGSNICRADGPLLFLIARARLLATCDQLSEVQKKIANLQRRIRMFVFVNELTVRSATSHWGVKKERGPLRSPESTRGAAEKRGKQEAKQKPHEPKQKPSTPIKGRAPSRWAAYAPTN